MPYWFSFPILLTLFLDVHARRVVANQMLKQSNGLLSLRWRQLSRHWALSLLSVGEEVVSSEAWGFSEEVLGRMHSLGEVLGVILFGKSRLLGSKQECTSRRVCTLPALQGIRFYLYGQIFSKGRPHHCSLCGESPTRNGGATQVEGVFAHY